MRTIGDRYIGGGKMFFTPFKKDGTPDTEFEICEVQSGQLTWNIEKKEAFSKDRVIKQMVEQIVTSIDGIFKLFKNGQKRRWYGVCYMLYFTK